MKKNINKLIAVLVIAIMVISILNFAGTVSSEQNDEDEPYTYYWVLGQNPKNSTVYIFAKYGAEIEFDGTISTPVTKQVDAGVFTSFNVADLGVTAAEKEFYYLEMNSDNPIMVVFNREVMIRKSQNEWVERHVDSLFKKPPMELANKYYYPFGHSGPADDKLVLYSHETTNVDIRMYNIYGNVYSKSIQINGLFEAPKMQLWMWCPNRGYGLTVTADKPIASALYDENPWWPSTSWGSGYFSGSPGLTELYDEYMHIQYLNTEYDKLYTLQANTISYFDENENLVGTRTYTSELSPHPTLNPPKMYYKDIGYDVTSPPYLVHTKSTSDYADFSRTPVATDIITDASYLGFNASLGELEIYTDQNAEIKVINAINNSITNFSMDANTVINKSLVDEFGFTPDQPFLITVISSVPVYQQIRMPGYLRQYPAIIGPGLEPTIRIEPETINLKSKGEFTAFIKLPDGFELENIDISTIMCEGAQAIDGNVADNNHLLVKFNRQDLVGVEPGDEVTFTVEGYFYDGTPFVGWDIVRVIDNGK
jgi:uncharacterized protein YneR